MCIGQVHGRELRIGRIITTKGVYKIMEDQTSSKEAETILQFIEPRLNELWEKLVSQDYNAATLFAFKLGFMSDIDKALRYLGVKRKPIRKEKVEALEVKDVEGEIDVETR